MKKLFFLSLVMLSSMASHSQQTWEKLFSALSEDVFRSVREVPTGGYIVAGYTANFNANDTDAYAVRLDEMGDTLWTYQYNGPMSKEDLFYKVIPTSDGGFAFCGYTRSVTGLTDDAMILKLNSSGQFQWIRFYGGTGKDRAQDIIQTSDDDYAVVGYTTTSPAQYYDAFLLRVKSNGDTLWSRRYGAANYDDANCVRQLSDGGFILGGQSSNGANGLDHFLVRTSATGSVYWTQRFGVATTSDNIECILVLPDGFIITGNTNSPVTGDDGYIAKTDTGGVLVWNKTYGGSRPDDFHSINFTSDGGYIATGTTQSHSATPIPESDIWLFKVNASGDSLWSRTFGGFRGDHGYSGQETSDGGFILVGYTGSYGYDVFRESYVLKTNSTGIINDSLVYTTVRDIITPSSLTCGSANAQIKVVLGNYSKKRLSTIPVTVNISGPLNTSVSQVFNAIASPADTVTFSTTINTSTPGTYTFYCYTDNDNDVYPERNSVTRTFTIEVTGSAPQLTGDSRCGSGTLTLNAVASDPVYWFTVPSGGTSIFTGLSYTTPTLNSTTTYYAQTGINCPSARVPVTATINPISADPGTTSDSRCGPGSLSLTAISADPVTWYDAPSGGNVVGTGVVFNTPVLTATTDYYAQASNGNCPSNRVMATAVISSVAADPVTASAERCGPGTVTLSATSSDPVSWFASSSGGSALGTGLSFTTPSLSATTTYYAQADNGCVSNRVAAVATVNTPPVVDLGADTVVNGTMFTLDAGPAASYVWSNGETTQTIQVSVTDNYCVTVTDVNGCTGSDCIQVDLITSISENDNSDFFSIYPNPARDKILMSFDHSVQGGTVEIIEMQGKLISTVEIRNSQELSVDIGNYARGVYFIRVKSADRIVTKKLIRE